MSDQESGEGWSGRMTCHACPVQIEGEVDGHAFYFRARWGAWSFAVSQDKLTNDNAADYWKMPQDAWGKYPRSQAVSGPFAFETEGDAEGDGGFGGSWMPHEEAWRHVRNGVEGFRVVEEKKRKPKQ